METLNLIGTIVGIATFIVLVGGGFYWCGRMSYRVDSLTRDVQSPKDDVQSLRDDMKAAREERKADMAALRNEIRGSEQRILTALANHSHVAPDAGQPVLRFLPGMEAPEPAAADGAPVEA